VRNLSFQMSGRAAAEGFIPTSLRAIGVGNWPYTFKFQIYFSLGEIPQNLSNQQFVFVD